ncbi:MAG: TAXI family TRAP transporter solute-binding subunit [Rhodospirillales bacterium]|nr:TAXI family TRAP transporter solute-binding subunit [Rhodospirillales bacterium]
MQKTTFSTMALALGTVALTVAMQPGEAAAQKSFIAIGTGGPTGVYFVAGNAICRMVHKEAAEGASQGRKHGIRCSAPSTGGSTYNIGQIAAGELEFGVAQSDWQYHSYKGDAPDKVKPFPKLRSVFSIYPEPYQIIVSKDAPDITSFATLKGKKFNIGNPGSGQRGTTEVLLKIFNMTTKDFAIATELTSTEQGNALCDGKIDAFGYTVGVPNAGVAVATDGCDARIINLNDDPVKKLVAETPYYAFTTIPKGTYKTSAEDVTTFGPMATLVTSADVSEDIVYEVVRAVFENLDDFRSLHPAFANLDPKDMTKNALSAPLHPGAVKYFKEKNLM